MQMQKFLTSAKASFFQVLLFGTFRKLGYLISRVLVIRTLLLRVLAMLGSPIFGNPYFLITESIRCAGPGDSGSLLGFWIFCAVCLRGSCLETLNPKPYKAILEL